MSGVLIDQKDSRFCAGIVQNWQRITQSAQRTRKNSVMVRAFQETSIIFLLSLLHETNADLRLHRQHQASLLHRPLHQLWNPRLHIRPKGSPHEIHGWWKKSLRGAGSRLSPISEPPPPSFCFVGPNFSHHKARVQAVGWFPVGDQETELWDLGPAC